jgi:2,3-bisphosphoglycerate-independent phosphoglycerate mutase
MAEDISKALLIILDGYGIAENPEVSAIDKADTPYIDELFEKHPHSTLSASGEDVGLPAGQFGNSEVGHLNLGAGRVVLQQLSAINKSIESGDFFKNETLSDAFRKAGENGRIHFMGLFSDGGVHSAINHLYGLLEFAEKQGIENTFVHAFTDGRDTDPESGIEYAREFQKKSEEIGKGTLASVVGRYYAMDRDNRWDRTQKAYDLLVHGKGEVFDSSEEAFQSSYDEGVTDEFIKPRRLETEANSRIQPGDVVIFFNIRGDRARQITRALMEDGFDEFPVEDLSLSYYTFTEYDEEFDYADVAFPPQDIEKTLGEVVSNQGLEQLRIAETEKYPHVTYFFNGGREEPYKGENRIIIPSPKVATYDLQPEMSAPKVADTLCEQLQTETNALCILNFANPDMVGHTGDMDAAVKAVETIDTQLKKVVETAQKHGYNMLIIADHGNADCLRNPDGSPHTSHTTTLVPVLLISNNENQSIHSGILADVAPTLLDLMNIEQPEEMTGKSLITD